MNDKKITAELFFPFGYGTVASLMTTELEEGGFEVFSRYSDDITKSSSFPDVVIVHPTMTTGREYLENVRDIIAKNPRTTFVLYESRLHFDAGDYRNVVYARGEDVDNGYISMIDRIRNKISELGEYNDKE
jgi:hypothetical protein